MLSRLTLDALSVMRTIAKNTLISITDPGINFPFEINHYSSSIITLRHQLSPFTMHPLPSFIILHHRPLLILSPSRATCDHRILTFRQILLSPKSLSTMRHQYCTTHPNKPLEIYCKVCFMRYHFTSLSTPQSPLYAHFTLLSL